MKEVNLKFGDTGDEVKILQEKLKILGFYNALITGIFGIATEEGVKAFQKQFNLEETGIVNNEMWNLLYELTENAFDNLNTKPILQIGSSGNDVKELQTILKNLLYYTGNIDSKFGKETEAALKRFQFHNKITANGIVNNQTWTLLDTLYGNLNDCSKEEESEEENNNNIYTIEKGDTLYSIARKFNTTVDELKQLNNLTSNTLSIGQKLLIPNSTTTPSYTYTVVSGDTLYSIARRFNTTVDELKQLNNLTNNTLSIGQKLLIPSSTITPSSTYTVVSGDTLYSIARRFNTTVDELKKLNNLTSNTLSIGQKLIISNITN